MNIRPTYDRVVVQKKSEEEVSKGGIIIPETARNASQAGTVVAVGPGRNIDAPGAYTFDWAGIIRQIIDAGFVKAGESVTPEERAGLDKIGVLRIAVERPSPQVQVGDTVLWGKHAGSEVKVGEETFYILREDEILAVLDEPVAVSAAPAA